MMIYTELCKRQQSGHKLKGETLKPFKKVPRTPCHDAANATIQLTRTQSDGL